MTRRPASAARPVYRVKAQPAGEGGYAVLRGGVDVLGDLHRSLASAMAHDLNAAVGSGRVYRCGPPSAAYECKVMASDGTKMKTPRVYVGDAVELVAHLNHAAMTGASGGPGWPALAMFGCFVLLTLAITRWAARRPWRRPARASARMSALRPTSPSCAARTMPRMCPTSICRRRWPCSAA